MRFFNPLYIVAILGLLGVYYINKEYVQQPTTFYGFADNKETEINQDRSVLIKEVLVTPGQEVAKGDLLMVVEHADLALKTKEIDFDIKTLQLKQREQKINLENEIRQLEIRRNEKIAETTHQIQTIQNEIQLNQQLIKDLKSISSNPSEDIIQTHPKIVSLQKELEWSLAPLDVQIEQYKKEIAALGIPVQVEVDKLKNEQAYFADEQKELSIYAPTDGLIGNIHGIEGEHKSSFSTLISFYERTPTLVKAYVHESLILKVNLGDTLQISSSLHPTQQGNGAVVGLGTRIVEIPERLRKVKDYKMYGREVLIELPPENPFLQKEKVVLNLMNTDNNSYLPFLTQSTKK